MAQKNSIDTAPLSLDAIFKALQHWRHNKSEYDDGGIPDAIWVMIFKLETRGDYSGPAMRKLFGLNNQQYQKKKTQLIPQEETNIKTPESEAKFAQAIIKKVGLQNVPPLSPAAKKTKQAVAHLKSHSKTDFPDFTTIIVEYIRPDGYRLKIHTTNKNIEPVVQSFFNQELSTS